MRILVIGIVSFIAMMSVTLADVYVKGYTRSDGTYVAPHYRSSPDSSHNNNWSTRGNRNPYTGKRGTQPRTYDDNPPDSYCSNCLLN